MPDPNQVKDAASFLSFLETLAEDCKHNGGEWQNLTTRDYLDSVLAWAKDSQIGSDQGLGEDMSWRKAAVILYAGKIYE